MQKAEMELRPTLWRTCRALMNATRLRMLRLAIEGEGVLCVRDYAKGLGLTEGSATLDDLFKAMPSRTVKAQADDDE